MATEKGFFIEVDIDSDAKKSTIKATCETILTGALQELKEDPEGTRDNLGMIKAGYNARAFRYPGETDRLSPARATVFYLSALYAASMREAALEYPSVVSQTLIDVSDGMDHVLGVIIQAESGIYSGSREYSAFMLQEAEYEDPDGEGVELLVGVTEEYITCLKEDKTGLGLLRHELVNMNMLMAGYDRYADEAFPPHEVFNPMNVRGARFAKDAYREIYPYAVEIFGNGNGEK